MGDDLGRRTTHLLLSVGHSYPQTWGQGADAREQVRHGPISISRMPHIGFCVPFLEVVMIQEIDFEETWLAQAYFIRQAHPVGKPPLKVKYEIDVRSFDRDIVQLTDSYSVVMPWFKPSTPDHLLPQETLDLLKELRGNMPPIAPVLERNVKDLVTVLLGRAEVAPNGWLVCAWGNTKEEAVMLAETKLLQLRQ